jgi:triosephosphate isomerase
MASRKLVAGNWKMHGLAKNVAALDAIAATVAESNCDVLVCPPFTLIARLSGRGVALGGQDCHPAANGAHTGDVSAEMLRDAGAESVIVGHSERRTDHRETDALVADKARAAWRAGLQAIVCVGETEVERDAGKVSKVVERQLGASVPDGATAEGLAVAYEPVWAIGTGRTPTLAEIGEVHGLMRGLLTERFGATVGPSIRLLYGGSVKPSNAADIFTVPDVDGALVGGASLTAEDFGPIIAAASASG